MNQTQRKTLLASLQKIRDQKLSQASVAFMNTAENRPMIIPQQANHSFQKMILTLMGQESEAVLKIPKEEVLTSISGNIHLNHHNLIGFFNARNQREVDNAVNHNALVKGREKTDLGAIKFRINREYNDCLDSLTLSTDYAESCAMLERFKVFTVN